MTSRLHVLHVIDALAVGGAERMLVEIANRTVSDGHRVAVCATRAAGPMVERLAETIELKILGRRTRFDARPLVDLARWIRARRFDVVHCHGRSSFSLLAMLAALRVASVPIVLHDHLGVEIHPEIPRWLPYAARYLAVYVGVYDAHATWAVRAGIPGERVRVIRNAIEMAAVDTRVVGPPLPLAPGRARLVTIGGIRREKGIDVLLEVIATLDVPVRLFVIGGDADAAYAARCRARAGAHDLVDRVTFLGERDDALALAATADLAVHASRSESGPLVLAEYAALGVPAISTRVGGMASALAKLDATWFVPPDDPERLHAALRAVLALSADERLMVGARQRESARALFDIAGVMPSWYAVYADAMRVHR